MAAGTANALTVTLTPQPASWASLVGAPLNILLTATNTGAATLAINGLSGTKPILRPGGAALVAGDLGAGGILRGIYDGAAIQLAGLTQVSARQTVPGTYAGVAANGAIQANGGAAGTGGSGGIIARSGMAGGIAYPIGSGQFVLAQGGPAYTSNFTYTIATGTASNGATGHVPWRRRIWRRAFRIGWSGCWRPGHSRILRSIMARYARIADSRVAEIIELDGLEPSAVFHPDISASIVPANAAAEAGWSYSNGKFTAPAPPAPPS
ncbi:hypothetical protein FQV39_03345 [Bosea sp. F3-2]|uniref:hypothetical protein n=1 Tax=Bosea sp. F3-2 TaxID=2599640 RepID=UPI0011EC362E|nr:hypothetical protein [Bosea sp. F3-2]QEL21719.1 hypothetical protein FQV39_03345 [Bosea sp. F3-2]